MRSILMASVAVLGFGTAVLGFSPAARSFCGFYVAQAGGDLFNHASKVVLARNGDRTAITMSSDVSGDLRDFALVVPVPTTIQREQVQIVQSATIDHLDSYTAPRLVEYHDEDPCRPPIVRRAMPLSAVPVPAPGGGRADALGVRVEASYSVGEYDIMVLSAQNSGGLLTWLNGNGYRMPPGAEPTVRSYLRQNMQFFVAKVNLQRQQQSGAQFLRPIRVEYRSSKFMLPIRLGTVNAQGPQEMIVLALTERGRVETTNYRTVRVPTGSEVPLYVRNEFGPFYKALFDRQVADSDGRSVFLEYAWDLGFCDPCSSTPMSRDELRELGAAWVDNAGGGRGRTFGGGQPAYVTRLHVRYDKEHFPEDLTLQETGDRESFQARYVMRHPFRGEASCEAGRRYTAELPAQFGRQARTLAELTAWPIETIRSRMAATGQALR